MVTGGTILLAGTLLLLLLSRAGEGVVYCYICVWTNTGNAEDTCQNENFNPSTATTESCDNGCRTFTLYERNETTMFTRQCADKTVHRSECRTIEMIPLVQQKHCYCSTNYCNAVDSIHGKSEGKAALVVALGLLITLVERARDTR